MRQFALSQHTTAAILGLCSLTLFFLWLSLVLLCACLSLRSGALAYSDVAEGWGINQILLGIAKGDLRLSPPNEVSAAAWRGGTCLPQLELQARPLPLVAHAFALGFFFPRGAHAQAHNCPAALGQLIADCTRPSALQR